MGNSFLTTDFSNDGLSCCPDSAVPVISLNLKAIHGIFTDDNSFFRLPKLKEMLSVQG